MLLGIFCPAALAAGWFSSPTREPPTPWCASNPLMGSIISRDAWHATEKAALQQIQSLPIDMMQWITDATDRTALEKRLNNGAKVTPAGGNLPEGGQPALAERWLPFQVSGDCGVTPYPPVKNRMDSATADGSKLLCSGFDAPQHSHSTPCVVYSIGSHDDWKFEEAIVAGTRCTIETFDCTVRKIHMPRHIKHRVRFHKICLGDSNRTTGGLEFLTIGSIMRMLGHDALSLLKMDIEGYEYEVLYSLFRSDDSWAYARLPHQIAIELHYQAGKQARGLHWYGRYLTVGEMANLAQAFYWSGYRIVSKEVNVAWPQCSEFTLLRYRC